MKVNEIFYSLQGEGDLTGSPCIFIRLAGCDMTCGFCDTEFESGKHMSYEDIFQELQKYKPCMQVVWTGGEPMLQLTDGIVRDLSEYGYVQCIETNGNHKLSDQMLFYLDHVVVSPKVADHVLIKNFPLGVDELRYPYHAGKKSVPKDSIECKSRYLSPIFDGDKVNKENLEHCIKLCLENPSWALSVQTHKLLKIL